MSVKVKKSKRLVARNWQEGEKTNSRRTDSGFFLILGHSRLGVLVKNVVENHQLSLPSTNQLISAITRKSGIAENQLFMTERGGLNPGTWMHEDIALDFAQWLSVDFRLWCNDRIKELLKHGITACILNQM